MINEMLYFPGWHNVNAGMSGTKSFARVCISYNRLESRKSNFPVNDWLLDCGFTRLLTAKPKPYPSTKKYSKAICHWFRNGNLLGAATQDFPSFAVSATNLSVEKHQLVTFNRYKSICKWVEKQMFAEALQFEIAFLESQGLDVDSSWEDYESLEDMVSEGIESSDFDMDVPYVMPILQGESVCDYLSHLTMYGNRINKGMWVGIGSLKVRSHKEIEAILTTIKIVRPDLRLHGFGLTKRLLTPEIQGLLFSADSAAGGLSGSKSRKYENSHNPAVAMAYAEGIESQAIQMSLFNAYE